MIPEPHDMDLRDHEKAIAGLLPVHIIRMGVDRCRELLDTIRNLQDERRQARLLLKALEKAYTMQNRYASGQEEAWDHVRREFLSYRSYLELPASRRDRSAIAVSDADTGITPVPDAVVRTMPENDKRIANLEEAMRRIAGALTAVGKYGQGLVLNELAAELHRLGFISLGQI